MKTNTKNLIAWTLVVVAIVVATFLGVRYPIPPAPEPGLAGAVVGAQNVPALNVAEIIKVGGGYGLTGCTLSATGTILCNGTIGADGAISTTAGLAAASVTSSGGITGTTGSFSGVVSTGALSVTGAVNNTTTQIVGTFLILTPATVITVTDGSIITPTTTYQPLAAAGAVGTASIAVKPIGTLLRLINTSAQTITITDTGTLVLSADIALGQYDTLLLLSDGVNWIQVATSNN